MFAPQLEIFAERVERAVLVVERHLHGVAAPRDPGDRGAVRRGEERGRPQRHPLRRPIHDPAEIGKGDARQLQHDAVGFDAGALGAGIELVTDRGRDPGMAQQIAALLIGRARRVARGQRRRARIVAQQIFLDEAPLLLGWLGLELGHAGLAWWGAETKSARAGGPRALLR